MFYAIILDANGSGTGSHAYAEQPKTIPANEVACTAAQAQNAMAWAVVNGALVESVPAAQAAQLTALRAACDAEMVAGFTSSALGAPHHYPSQPLDQSNLIGAATTAGFAPAGWTVNFWCADASGAWNNPPHTAAQIQQALLDGTTAREAISGKLKTLTAQVGAATSVADVQAVVW